jgi:D-alanine--poly(phosphoribitol) ligase subunit 1
MKFCFVQKDFIDTNVDRYKIAVIGDDFELTWEQFEVRVNNLCDEFIRNSCERLKFPVIIYGHKSANMIVAIYAMMKLEMVYIPIDLIYPNDRISKIVEVSESQLIINTSTTVLGFENTSELILKDSEISFNKKLSVYKKAERVSDPLVYIIFTSGSTGEPKGVQISTEAVQSFVRWMTTDFNFGANDVFINSAILSFDLSVFEVMTFGGLGGTILLNGKDIVSDPNLLIDRVQKYLGTVWVSTPSYALVYSRIGVEPKLESVKTFLFCGEVLPHGLAKKLVENFKQAKVINTYGPTEATVATTLVEIDDNILSKYDPLPVGKTKRESKLLIENDEIVIVGSNVSVGYFKDPILNKEKFKLIDEQRAFKTGDKGYLEDEMLFFNGRDDDLVKLHGYRIELNEITAEINNLNYILHGETVALKRKGIVKKIVSLVQISSNFSASISVEKIKEDLAEKLPHYMIPSDIKFVGKIPLKQNGKADKKILNQIYLQK